MINEPTIITDPDEKRAHSDCITRPKILKAATRIFSEYGFKDATVRMICSEANVNIALVNYHYNSKADLYCAVVNKLFRETAKKLEELPGSIHDEESWKAAVRSWIANVMSITAATKTPDRYLSSLIGKEETEPSSIREVVEKRYVGPIRDIFYKLVKMAKPEISELELQIMLSMVSAQCSICAIVKPSWGERFRPESVSKEQWAESIIDATAALVTDKLHFQGVTQE